MSILGTITIASVDPDRFKRIQGAAEQEFGGQSMAGNTGTVSKSGVEVDYSWDGTANLTLNIVKLPSIFGHPLVSIQTAEQKLAAWVDGIQ